MFNGGEHNRGADVVEDFRLVEYTSFDEYKQVALEHIQSAENTPLAAELDKQQLWLLLLCMPHN